MAKVRKPESLMRPWSTVHGKAPGKKTIEQPFIDYYDLAQRMADEFNLLTAGHALLREFGQDIEAEDMANNLRDFEPKTLLAYFAESSFGRGFILGLLQQTNIIELDDNGEPIETEE
jgi:hypothetical protein